MIRRLTSRKDQKQTCSFNRVVFTMCLFSIRYQRFKRQCHHAQLTARQAKLSHILFMLKKDNPASSVCLVQRTFSSKSKSVPSTFMSQHSLLMVFATCVDLKLSVVPDKFSTDTDTDRLEPRDNQITCSTCGSYHIFRGHVAPVNTHRGCDCRLFSSPAWSTNKNPASWSLPPHRPHCKPPP